MSNKTKEDKGELVQASEGFSPALVERSQNTDVTGLENITAADMALTRFTVLQPKSPQCDPTNSERIEGVQAGQLFNGITQEALDELIVAPIGFDRVVVEFRPRTQGGGFVAKYYDDGNNQTINSAEYIPDDQGRKKLTTKDGNHLVETADHYVTVLPKDPNERPYVAVLSMSASQLKHSRRWVSQMANKTIPGPNGPTTLQTFFQKYRIKPGTESNNQGHSWFGYTTIDYLGPVDDEYLSLTEEAAKAISTFISKSVDMQESAANTSVPTGPAAGDKAAKSME